MELAPTVKAITEALLDRLTAIEDEKEERWILTGRRAVRARRRGLNQHRPQRSRCQRRTRKRRTGGCK